MPGGRSSSSTANARGCPGFGSQRDPGWPVRNQRETSGDEIGGSHPMFWRQGCVGTEIILQHLQTNLYICSVRGLQPSTNSRADVAK